MAPERMVTVAIDLPLRIWLRLRQETRQRAYAKGELEPETISPIVREILEEAIDRLDREHSNAGTAATETETRSAGRKRAAGGASGGGTAEGGVSGVPGNLFGEE